MLPKLLICSLAIISFTCHADQPDPFDNLADGLHKVGDKKTIKSIMRVKDQKSCFEMTMTIEQIGEFQDQGKMNPVTRSNTTCSAVKCPAESMIHVVKGNPCETIARTEPKTISTIYTGKIDPSMVILPMPPKNAQPNGKSTP